MFIGGDSLHQLSPRASGPLESWVATVSARLDEPDLVPPGYSVFAVLDAARDTAIFEGLLRLQDTGRVQSLFQGRAADDLRDVCPYLIDVSAGTPLRDWMLRRGWGRAWGILIATNLDFRAVRRHLRKLTMVEIEGEEDRFLFRFYDPRVLAPYLRSCEIEDLKAFFGPLGYVLLEGGGGRLVERFAATTRGLVEYAVDVPPRPVMPPPGGPAATKVGGA